MCFIRVRKQEEMGGVPATDSASWMKAIVIWMICNYMFCLQLPKFIKVKTQGQYFKRLI